MNETEMNHKQAVLAGFTQTTRQCSFPGCSTLTMHRLCTRHRDPPQPSGSWQLAALIKAENGANDEGE